MKVALEVWSSKYDEVESACLLAESLGLDGFYYGESPHELNLDCWTTLGALARSTERIRLGPVITNILPTYRSVVLLAKQAATVASLSGGRADFRTGVGAATKYGRPWWEPFGVDYPGYGQRFADLRTALDVLPRIWSGRPIDMGPEAVPVISGPARIDAAVTIPITIAATGDRAMQLAATRADVWETSFCTPREFAERNARFAALADERPAVRSLEIDGFVSLTGAGLNRMLDRVRADRGKSEDLGPVLERALVGTPADAVGRLRALAEVGVDQVVVALHDPLDRHAIEALAETAALFRG